MNFKARLLLIDDRRSEVWFIERILQKEGFEIITAFDGLEGLQKVADEKPDLIILDTIMPKMDGYKVYHNLKENPDTIGIPVLFLSDRGEAYERSRIASAGHKSTAGKQGNVENSQAVVGFLTKPVEAKELMERVEILLQSIHLKANSGEVIRTKSRILLIDDDVSLVQRIESTLRQEGLDVCSSFDGLEGLQKIKEEKPDLIILDTVMPGLNGLQVLQYVREYSKVPVIMIPGQMEADLLVKALVTGAEAYLIKPFNPTDLLALIQRKLSKPGVP